MPDDLSLLKEPAFAAGLNDLDDLLTQSGKAFLIGDGCSKCMGLSLMAELTANTLASEKLSTTTKTSLSAIQGRFADANAANIEDYLRELVDLAATYAFGRIPGGVATAFTLVVNSVATLTKKNSQFSYPKVLQTLCAANAIAAEAAIQRIGK